MPTTNRFEVNTYSGLRSRIAQGDPLQDIVRHDTDGNGFSNSAYDVTLALRNFFNIPALNTQTYLTQTIFGNAVPPAPGSSEAVPLLPSNDQPPFNFVFEASNQTIWVDPPVSIGFEYEVTSGPRFASVTAPSFATVPDPDGYEVWVFNGSDFIFQGNLATAASFDFTTLDANGIDRFQLRGINPALGLDPNNPLAFPTGLAFISPGTVSMTMTPLTASVSAVPEPSTVLLIVIGVLALRFASSGTPIARRRH